MKIKTALYRLTGMLVSAVLLMAVPSVPAKAEVVQDAYGNEILSFVDVKGNPYQVLVDQGAPRNQYDPAAYQHFADFVVYFDGKYISRPGVDVSYYQGDIDWNAVKAAGYQFAILRIGYRGYRAGSLAMDPKFYQNLAGAQAAGLDIGVYFFAQAVNEQEAVEEADYVLGILQGYPLTMPIVYDPETIESPAARTNSVSGEQLTKNAAAFCDEIRKGGYTPMIYSNMLWQAYKLNMSELGDELFWYADYEPLPQTPYNFAFWQHSQSAFVPGVPTACDVDIQMLPIPQLP